MVMTLHHTFPSPLFQLGGYYKFFISDLYQFVVPSVLSLPLFCLFVGSKTIPFVIVLLIFIIYDHSHVSQSSLFTLIDPLRVILLTYPQTP